MTRGKHENNNSNKLSRGETICPRRSQRIYVRARTDPQSAQLWRPGRGTVRLGTARLDRQMDGRQDRAATLNAPLRQGA